MAVGPRGIEKESEGDSSPGPLDGRRALAMQFRPSRLKYKRSGTMNRLVNSATSGGLTARKTQADQGTVFIDGAERSPRLIGEYRYEL